MRALISGDWIAAIIAAESRSMIGAGVPAGAKMPSHSSTLKPGRVSPTVMTSGSPS